jgi:hypothetical protein
MTGFSKLAVYRQELPPSGGYAPIPWSRAPGRRIPLWPFVSLWAASNVFGYFYHIAEKRQYWQKGNIIDFESLINKENGSNSHLILFILEMDIDESRSCIEPVILAEQDRIVLRQYRANRDEEAKLMSDVPGWEVGTWFGDKVFKSRMYFPDRPHLLDYYGLARPSTQRSDFTAAQWQL